MKINLENKQDLGARLVGVRVKPRIYLASFCKAHLITESPHIFLEKSKNRIHKFVKALFLVFL